MSPLDTESDVSSPAIAQGSDATSAPFRVARGNRGAHWLRAAGGWALVLSLAAMIVVFGLTSPDTFLSSANLSNVLDQCVVPVILACGVTFILSTGEFDLSFGNTLALSSATFAYAVVDKGIPWQLAMLMVLAVSLVLGVGVGYLVTLQGASSFIVTLAVGSAFAGVEIALAANQPVFIDEPGFGSLSSNSLFGVHWPVYLCAVVIVVTTVLLHGTRFGRHTQSLGGNIIAARLAGVRVNRVKILCFTLTAVLAATGGLILTSRSGAYFPGAGSTLVLSSYAAVFLGATVGRSGRFMVLGSVLGAVWMIVLQTGLTMNNAPTWSATLIQGVVLALAVLVGSRIRAGASS